jgi:hypothetical protein
MAVSDVNLEVLDDGTAALSHTGRRTGDRSSTGSRAGSLSSTAVVHGMSAPPAKVDKRLTQIHVSRKYFCGLCSMSLKDLTPSVILINMLCNYSLPLDLD